MGAPPDGLDQSDTHADTPKAEESAQEPLIELNQAQKPTESANEGAQPYDPDPNAEVANESRIDTTDPESQSMISIPRFPAAQVF